MPTECRRFAQVLRRTTPRAPIPRQPAIATKGVIESAVPSAYSLGQNFLVSPVNGSI